MSSFDIISRNYRNIYRDKLLKEDYIMIGFHDDIFEFGKTYKVFCLDDKTTTPMPNEFFTGNLIRNNNGEIIPIMGDKIFKFISLKENRKLKLQKLKKKNKLLLYF